MFKRIIARFKANNNSILVLNQRANNTDVHLIALCRLLFIKPEVLIREVNNAKANGEYLLKLMNERQNLQEKTTK